MRRAYQADVAFGAERVVRSVAYVALACGCRDEPYAWESRGRADRAGQTIAIESAEPGRGANARAPSSSSGPAPSESARGENAPDATKGAESLSGRPFVRCAEGFVSSGDPLRDVTKLGVACGPSTGMTALGDATEGAIAEGGAELVVPLGLVDGRCYRVFAAAESSVSELDAEIVSSRGVALGRDHTEGRVAVVQPDRAMCALAADDASVVVRAKKGVGRAAAWIWSVDSRTGH
jgi:hypothetical protein